MRGETDKSTDERRANRKTVPRSTFGVADDRLLRALTPIAKLTTAKQAVACASESSFTTARSVRARVTAAFRSASR